MPLSVEAGKAIGKLFRNLRNPRAVAEATGVGLTGLTVFNYANKQVKAEKKGKLVHKPDDKSPEVHLGDIYHCPDGHDYIHSNGKTYRYDKDLDAWFNA